MSGGNQSAGMGAIDLTVCRDVMRCVHLLKGDPARPLCHLQEWHSGQIGLIVYLLHLAKGFFLVDKFLLWAEAFPNTWGGSTIELLVAKRLPEELSMARIRFIQNALL